MLKDLLPLNVMIIITNGAFISKLDFFGIYAMGIPAYRTLRVMMEKRGRGNKQKKQGQQYGDSLPGVLP